MWAWVINSPFFITCTSSVQNAIPTGAASANIKKLNFNSRLSSFASLTGTRKDCHLLLIMWILISVCLAMAVSASDSVYVPCNTNYTLVPETHVAIQNVGYPSNFQTPYNCFWTFTGPAAGYFKQIICTNYTMGAPCDLNFIKVNGGKICPLPASTSIKTKKEALEINIQGATAPGRFNCTVDLPVDPCSCSRIVKVVSWKTFSLIKCLRDN